MIPNGRQVRINVRMVEFQAREDRCAGMVFEELRGLVEVRRIVLVPLDDEDFPVPQGEIGFEVAGDATDEESRPGAQFGEDMSGQRGRRGLSVGAHHRDAMPPGDGEPVHRLGHGKVGQASAAHLHRLRIGFLDHIAHDNQVGIGADIFRTVAIADGDAHAFQVIAHGRIDLGIAAADVHAQCLQRPGQGRHGRSADAHQVHVTRRSGVCMRGRCMGGIVGTFEFLIRHVSSRCPAPSALPSGESTDRDGSPRAVRQATWVKPCRNLIPRKMVFVSSMYPHMPCRHRPRLTSWWPWPPRKSTGAGLTARVVAIKRQEALISGIAGRPRAESP